MENSLEQLAKDFLAQPDCAAFQAFGAMSERDPRRFKPIDAHPRIYPFYFAPVIFAREAQCTIVPMRYRLRPHDSKEEPPAKYNLYNARLDALTTRRTWQGLFMRNHGVLAFKSFFEWVTPPDGKKCVIQFTPEDRRTLCAPVLYDTWQAAAQNEGFFSFAVITTDPPPEVRRMGHDRCPVILRPEEVDCWLHPGVSGMATIQQILRAPGPVKFFGDRVAAIPK